MTWSENVMLHTSQSVWSSWTHLWCFHRSAGDLLWPKMTLATWRGVTGHNSRTQGANSTCNTMFESVLNGFCPKETPFIFLPLTYNGEVAKLTWPWVTDIKIPRYIFYRYWYGYQSLEVSRWSRAFGVAMTSIQTFSGVRWLDVIWWPDIKWPGSDAPPFLQYDVQYAAVFSVGSPRPTELEARPNATCNSRMT